MNFGNVTLKSNIFLAPMAGVTDLPFRKVCRVFGAGAAVSEMVSSKAIYYKDKKTTSLLQTDEGDMPLGVQIFGSEPAIMAFAAEHILACSRCEWIDINMGCPMPKIAGSGDGCALMKTPKLIFEIVTAVKKTSSVPVTVKMRSGYSRDSINAAECALAAEAGGADLITVHGKTREQLYAPPVNHDIIRQVKAAVRIPVVGNGDIQSGEDAARMVIETGCDGIMIGRAALGNPFIFEEIASFLVGEHYVYRTVEERMQVACRHIKELSEYKGEHIGILEARKHLAWYLKGVPGAAKLRQKINSMKTLGEAVEITAEATEGIFR